VGLGRFRDRQSAVPAVLAQRRLPSGWIRPLPHHRAAAMSSRMRAGGRCWS
jgi:hypothetical protein